MTTAPAASRRRTGLFAYPAETSARLALVILLAVATGLFGYQVISFRPEAVREMAARCSATPSTQSLEELVQRAQALARCLAPYHEREALAMLVGACVVLVGALVFELASPAWRIRRRRLRPLSTDDARFGPELRALSEQAGLRRPPQFHVAPLGTGATAVAFGALGRDHVALDAGLLLALDRDPPLFRAIVLHELGHVRNRDLGWTWYSLGCVVAVGVGVLVPFAVALALRGFDRAWWADAVVRIAVLAAFVWATRVAVLRVREVYADARALEHPGVEPVLRRALGHLAPLRGAWRRRWSVHPNPESRARALAAPEEAVRPRLLDALAAGVAAFVARDLVQYLVALLVTRMQNAFFAPVVVALTVGSVFGATLVLPTYRDASLAALRGAQLRARQLFPLALAAALGGALGRALSFRAVFKGTPALLSRARVLGMAGWTAMLFLGLWAVLCWTAVSAWGWAHASSRWRSPRAAWVPAVSSAVLLIAGWIVALDVVPAEIAAVAARAVSSGSYALSVLAPAPRDLAALEELLASPFSVVVALGLGARAAEWCRLLTLVVLCAVPFAGVAARRTPDPVADGGVHRAAVAIPEPLAIRRALRAGAIGAAIFVALLVALHLWVRTAASPALRADRDFRFEFMRAQVALAVVVQGSVAWFAARRELRVLHALLAGVVASLLEVLAVTVLWRYPFHGRWFDLGGVLTLLDGIAVPGAVLGAAVAGLRSLLGGGWGALRRRAGRA